MLKPWVEPSIKDEAAQPPSGGCVLKPKLPTTINCNGNQPPSGGCVLKLCQKSFGKLIEHTAAFRRLCVET